MARAAVVEENPLSAHVAWRRVLFALLLLFSLVMPSDWTIATVPARFAALGDLHAGIDDAVFSLDTLLEWAERDERDEPDQVPTTT